MQPAPDLDRRIIAALQVNGRASWTQIAEVLGEAERTVARRGTELLELGIVRVVGFSGPHSSVLVRVSCATGTVRTTATALAQRADCVFAYALSGSIECVAQLQITQDRLATVVLEELPGTIGLIRAQADPEIRTFRSVRQWHPGILNADQVRRLSVAPFGVSQPNTVDLSALKQADHLILRELAVDGRASTATLARAAGVSETTARRRLEWLQASGMVWLRAIVEPAVLGFPVEAMLWMKVRPGSIDVVAEKLLDAVEVRWAVALAGEYDLAVDVAVRDSSELYSLVSSTDWGQHVNDIETTVVLEAMKRSRTRVST